MPKQKWKFEDIPDQSGKTTIVTGSNTGTGFEVAKALARKGAHVVMACRNLEKANAAKEKILSEYPEVSLEVIQLDLSDLKSVRRFVDEFNSKHNSLDILCNNAGVMMVPKGKTIDGFETHLGVNHFGHFALTGLLLDKLLKNENSRVVNMSSGVHVIGTMDFENLNWERKYNRNRAYGRSKLANLLFTYELHRKASENKKKLISVCAHPGWTGTDLQRHARFFRFLNPLFAMKPPQGALPMLFAATAPEVNGGEYFGPNGFTGMRGYPAKVDSNKKSHNLEDAQKLWETSEELTGVRFKF